MTQRTNEFPYLRVYEPGAFPTLPIQQDGDEQGKAVRECVQPSLQSLRALPNDQGQKRDISQLNAGNTNDGNPSAFKKARTDAESLHLLDELPPELICHILTQLPGDALFSVLGTCSQLQAYVEMTPELYKKHLMQQSVKMMAKLLKSIQDPDQKNDAHQIVANSKAKIDWSRSLSKAVLLTGTDKAKALCELVKLMRVPVGEDVAAEASLLEEVHGLLRQAQALVDQSQEETRVKENTGALIAKTYFAFVKLHMQTKPVLAEGLIRLMQGFPTADQWYFSCWNDNALEVLIHSQARKNIPLALESYSLIRAIESKDLALRKIFKVQSKQDPVQALALINDFGNPYWKVESLCKLALIQDSESNEQILRFEEACQKAENISARLKRMNALCLYAKAYAQAFPATAQGNFKKMIEKEMRHTSDEGNRNVFLCKIAKVQALTHLNEALETLQIITDEYKQVKAYSRIAVKLAYNDLDSARKIYHMIPEDSEHKCRVLFKIVVELAFKKVRKARNQAKNIKNPTYKARAFAKIAKGQMDKAEALFKKMRKKSLNQSALEELTERVEYHVKKAEKIACRIDKIGKKIKTLCRIAKGCSTMGKKNVYGLFQKAIAMAARIEEADFIIEEGRERKRNISTEVPFKKIKLLNRIFQALARV